MTDHVQDIHGIFKAIAEMKLCGTAKLIAITIELHQTTDVAELMTLTGESRRIVQMYRASYLMARETRESSEKDFAKFAKDAKPVSPDDKEVSPTPPSRNNNNITIPVTTASQQEPASMLAGDLSDEMVRSVMGWVGMPEANARNWLATTIKTFGQQPTARAYHQLKTELVSGGVIAFPLKTWSTIAERMRAQPVASAKPKSKLLAALDAGVAP